VRICSVCGEENSDRARFCQACAAPLALALAEDVRRTVTIVFSDLVGSTALGERLDSEALRSVLARYFDAMRDTLERHGGRVEKYIGDAIMAVFGLPQLHEDDALRAVRAASEMQHTLTGLNDELEHEWGVRLANRTGVQTGEVVAGDPALGQRLITGDTVNVTARLEQAAPTGEVLLGEATYLLVRGAVEVDPVTPLELKGKTEPVPAYRLVSVTATAEGFTRKLDTSLVGRTEELTAARAAFTRARDSRSGWLLLVAGAPGVGKSRLLAELANEVAGEARVLRGRCLSYGEGITYWPLAEALAAEAGIDPEDQPDEAVDRLGRLLGGVPDHGLIVERLASAMGLSTQAHGPEDVSWAARRALEHMAWDRPVVWVLEDLQWAEPTFLDLVEQVVDLARDAPLLVAASARPEFLEARSDWRDGPRMQRIDLQPLSEQESEELVSALLGQTPLPEDLKARIGAIAHGNPLFVEQILAMLIDRGVLWHDGDRWEVAGELSAVEVPPTIAALMAARLDALPAEERTVSERASVVGQVFYRRAVADLSPTELRHLIDPCLDSLGRKQFVGPDESTFAGERAHRFLHILIRDAAYGGMLHRVRAELHERFADWVARQAGERHVEVEEIVGYHLEQAYRYRVGIHAATEDDLALASRAVDRLASAGRRAWSRGDFPAAAGLLRRAIDLLPASDGRRPDLLPELAMVLFDGARLDESAAAIEEAEQTAHPSTGTRAAVARVVWRAQTDPTLTHDELAATVQELIPHLEVRDDDLFLALAWRALGVSHYSAGRAQVGREVLDRAVEHARRAGHAQQLGEALQWQGPCMVFGPTPAEETIRAIRPLLDRTDASRHLVAGHRLGLAHCHAMLGDFDTARALLAEGTAMLEELGAHLMSVGGVAIAAANVEILAGDLGAAERSLFKGYRALERIGETSVFSTVAGSLATLMAQQGRFQEADRFADVGQATSQPDDIASQYLWRAARAMAMASRAEPGAEALAREALAILEPTDFLEMTGDARMYLAQVLWALGRADEARVEGLRGVELYRRKGNVEAVRQAMKGPPFG
jgi:class 3 adenylate cyclase/tetratricopeptide (TPR) repeat protein